MDNLPPELHDRRDSIFDRVTTTGRTRRRRRTAAAFAVVAVVLAIPITAVAMNASHESPGVRVSSVPSTSVTPTVPDTTGTTDTTVRAGCHDSQDPACGPIRYDPPITNEPARIEITSVTPAVPKVGETVTFTLRARDPDSLFSASSVWCNGGGRAGASFGDDSPETVCIADCVGPGFGTWDPPAPQPSDLTFHSDHVYNRAGTFAVKITAEAGVCSARPSEATVSTTVTVVAG
jgi:hypothetical protein